MAFEALSETFEEGEFAAFTTETVPELMVAWVADAAENATPFLVARIGWRSSVSIWIYSIVFSGATF